MARTNNTMTQCKICGSEDIYNVPTKVETVTVCRECGYGYPSLRDPIIYSEDYERKYNLYPEHDICNIRLSFVRRAEDIFLKAHTGKSILKILDYGCGSGAFVRASNDAGYEAYGYDVNDYTEDLRPGKGFVPEIVTLWDSFEHLTDEEQAAFFEKFKSVKMIVVSVPDFSSACLSIDEWRHYRPKEHLHYYTSSALTQRFLKEGYFPAFISHDEDLIRKAPWKNNILSMGFVK